MMIIILPKAPLILNCVQMKFSSFIIVLCVCACNQNIPKRIATSSKGKNHQEESLKRDGENKDNTKGQQEDVVAKLNRNAAAAVAAMAVGRGPETRGGAGGGGMLNQDTGESYLKSVEFNRNILRDSVGGGGSHKGVVAEDWKDIGSTAKPTTTTEKYPMQWGFQVLPTLYSIYQKVLVLANRRTIIFSPPPTYTIDVVV